MRRALLTLTLAACAAVFVSPAWAGNGTLTGTIKDLPAGSTSQGVEAVNAQGEVGAVGSLSATGTYKLNLRSGIWAVVAGAASGDEPFAALAGPVRVRSHHTSHAAPARAKQEASAAAATRRLPRNAVVTIDPILLQDERDFTNPAVTNVDYTSVVINDLFGACAAHGIVFVDQSTAFLGFARQESRLSREGRLSVPFAYHPLKPMYEVEPDSGQESTNTAGAIGSNSVGIRISVDRAGTVSPISEYFAGPNLNENFTAEVDDETVLGVVHKEDAALARKICG